MTQDSSTVSKSLKSEYLVDSILPTNEVHLIAGPSGSGKTTWLLKFIEQWAKGSSFFGYESHPMPFVYIGLDRSRKSIQRTFDRMKLDASLFSIEVPTSEVRRSDMIAILKALKLKYPKAKVYFIEGFQSMTPAGKMNEYQVVARYLTDCQEFCELNDITIVGVAHTTKTKKDEQYTNPRQKINGSVAWAAFTETIFIIEPSNPDDPNDSTRVFMMLPRNAKEQIFYLDFKDGLLIEKPKVQVRKSNYQTLLDYLMTVPIGTQLRTDDLIKATNLSSSSIHIELNKTPGLPLIRKVSHGVYLVTGVESKQA